MASFKDITNNIENGVKAVIGKDKEEITVTKSTYTDHSDNRIAPIKKNNKEFRTLDILKKINNDAYYRNAYFVNALAHDKTFDSYQKDCVKVWEVMNGNKEFYKHVIFGDTINLMTSTITNEVLSDFKIKLNDEEIEDILVRNLNLKFIADNLDLPSVIKMGLDYGKMGLKVNINNGKYTFEYLEPFKYRKKGNSVEIYQFINGKFTTEVRSFDGEVLNINGQDRVSNNLLFFEITIPTFTVKGIEKIFEYDIMRSEVTKETLLNGSKVMGNRNYFKNNPINIDFIHTLDVPDSMKMDEDSRQTMLTTYSSNISLSEKIDASNQKASELTQGYKLNKKILGIDNSSQDFASSLKYENDTPAKTINNIRKVFANQLERILIIITGQPINVEFGKYKLESSEAKAELNIKCKDFLSIRDQIAQYLDLPSDDPQVLIATWRTKNDKNITPDFAEEEEARKQGLLPTAIVEDYEMQGD